MNKQIYNIDGDGNEFLSRLRNVKDESVIYIGDFQQRNPWDEGEVSLYNIHDSTVIVSKDSYQVQIIAENAEKTQRTKSKMDEICRTEAARLI